MKKALVVFGMFAFLGLALYSALQATAQQIGFWDMSNTLTRVFDVSSLFALSIGVYLFFGRTKKGERIIDSATIGLFSMEGRLNRAKYFWYSLAIAAAVYLLAFAIILVTEAASGDDSIAGIFAIIIVMGAGAIVTATQTVKRFHDLDRSGSHYWLLFIPIFQIYPALQLLFKKGTTGANKYGLDPLDNS
jgi:uncharacterized membrane protein YhaH (DUF805 family)